MSRIVSLTESDLYYLIENILSEIKKDVNQPLWNVYKIPSKIGANGYAISSNYSEDTLLPQLIAFAKNKWKEGKTVLSTNDEDGSGYMFKYIITLIKKSALENPSVVKNKMGFTKFIANNFNSLEKVNEEPLTKADAEMLKRNVASMDPNSFKKKGAALFRELEKAGIEKKSLSKLSGNFKEIIEDLFEYNQLQYYDEDGLLLYHKVAMKDLLKTNLPQSLKDELVMIDNDPQNTLDPASGKKLLHGTKSIPKDSKIYKTLTAVGGYTPIKLIRQKK